MDITTRDEKLETLSERYKLVPTKLIADKFKSMGFVVDNYSEVRVRKNSRQGFQKHQVRLSNPNLMSTVHPDVKLQLIVTNSHDGLSSFVLQLGFFRFVCSNGLVVGETFEKIRLRHTGMIIEEIDQAVERIVAQIKKLDDSITKMKTKVLTADEKTKFLEAAVKLRNKKMNASDIVIPVLREEDSTDDVFTFYNRVQESLIRGGTEYTNSLGRTRQLRAVSNINRLNEINQGLFDIALQFAA